jgi:hypothetical protein
MILVVVLPVACEDPFPAQIRRVPANYDRRIMPGPYSQTRIVLNKRGHDSRLRVWGDLISIAGQKQLFEPAT